MRSAAIARKCIGFLQRTAGYHLKIVASDRAIASWSDSSFAPEGGRSHSGWIITLGSAPVMWRSSRQSVVTLSTAEAELAASVEGALALASVEALLHDLGFEQEQGVLMTDSQSALSIQKGSCSWRTRHLRIKANWVTERLETGALRIEHCPGEQHIADALTKPLAAARLTLLSKLLGLMPLGEIQEEIKALQDALGAARTSTSDCGVKVLIALLVLSQAVVGCDATELTVYQPVSIDHGLVMWCVFAVIALLWTLAWEFIKFAGWQLYYNAVPGAGSRRLHRLQRIRDTTADAIRTELESRRQGQERSQRTPVEVQRARADLEDYLRSASGQRNRSESATRVSSTPLEEERLTYRSSQKDRAVQTTGPAFVPQPSPVRTEFRIPENIHIVPGGQCFHVFNPCHAFRHRGTQGKVCTLRICEYCVRHQGRDPQLPGPGIDEILRSGLMPNFDRPGASTD